MESEKGQLTKVIGSTGVSWSKRTGLFSAQAPRPVTALSWYKDRSPQERGLHSGLGDTISDSRRQACCGGQTPEKVSVKGREDEFPDKFGIELC